MSTEAIKISVGTFVHMSKGRVLEMYTLNRVIGQGAFGKVFHATHIKTGVDRAIKCVDKQNLSPESARRMMEEVEILRELDHPNIIRVIEVIEDERNLNIVMELCQGGEMFDRIISTKQFSERIAARYMFQIMTAIAHCHKLGVVHRDIKPENVVFATPAEDSVLKVIDFGISKKFFKDTPLRKRYGTPYYIAPEVLQGSYTEKCDVWSCGVLLFILLSGEPPFPGRDPKTIMTNVMRGTFQFASPVWASISSSAKEVITRMLTRDPEVRPSASDVWSSPWIQGTDNFDHTLMPQFLESLQRFHARQKFQHAALTYIASQLLTATEVEHLKDAFYQLDKDGDGKISIKELYEAYESSALQLPNMEQLLKEADSDQNGFLDYTEFLTAASNWSQLLTKERLEVAFRAFDTDNSGTISKNELKAMFHGDDLIGDDVWQAILQEADRNADGVIDFQEFEQVMTLKAKPI